MPALLWDASALAKRYSPERGSDTVDSLFETIPAPQMVATVIGYAEAYSLLLRKRNRSDISEEAFRAAKTALRDEVTGRDSFDLLTVDDAAVFSGIALIEQHNINATDAAILALFLRFARLFTPPCVVVAADERLIRAAEAEGLKTMNPELVAAADVPDILAAL